MSFMDELDAITGISPKAVPVGYNKITPTQAPEPSWMNELDAIAGTTQQPPVQSPEQAKPEFSTSRFIGEQLAKGTLQLADLPVLLGNILPNPRFPEEWKEKAKDIGMRTNQMPEPGSEPYPSQYVPEKLGINLNTQPEDTALKRITGHGLRALPGAILGGIPGLARNAAMAGVAGTGSGALQEVGVPAPIADIASIGTTALAPMAISKLAPSGLTGNQKQIAKFLKKQIGESERKGAIEALENATPYPETGFETSVAGEANSPALAHLHRLQQDSTNPHLGALRQAGTEKLTEGFKKHAGPLTHAEHGETLRQGLNAKLKQLTSERRAATQPQYEAIKKNESLAKTSNLKEFFKENKNVSGDLEKDLRYIKKSVKPTDEKSFIQLSDEAENLSTIGRLTEAEKALTARIEKYRHTQPSRVPLYKQAKEALGKDLEHFPEYAAVKKTYAEKSIPISELKNPSLKKIFKKEGNHYTLSENNIADVIFDKRSHFNINSLEKSLGKESDAMNDIRKAAINHYYEAITNAGEEGSARVLSFNKMNKFNKKHELGLKKLLSEDQKKFIDEANRAVVSQNRENTLGVGQGSPTAGRLRSQQALDREFQFYNEPWYSLNPKAQTAKWGRNLPFVRDWLAKRPERLSNALSEVLADKKLAHEVLKRTFKNQTDFNQFMSDITRMSATHATDKEEEK